MSLDLPVLNKVFDSVLLEKFFTLSKLEGISLSRAQGIKNDNSNRARQLLTKFTNFNIYTDTLTAISSQGTVEKTVPVEKLTVENFNDLQTIANLYAQNAILGHAINLRNRLERKLFAMDDNEWIRIYEFTFPKTSVVVSRKSISTMNLDKLLSLDRLEEILENVNAEVLESFSSGDIFSALQKESRLAVLGNQLTARDAFFNSVLEANKSLPVEEESTNFALILREKRLAYSEEEVAGFSVLQQSLYKEYSETQMELNGFKKLLKDKIREVQLKYDNEYSLSMKALKEEQDKISKELMEIAAKIAELKTLAMKELASLKIRA